MRTGLTLVIGLCIGVAGAWYLLPGQEMSPRAVSSAWAQPDAKGTAEKPWTEAELEEIATFYEDAAESVEDEALEYERTAASLAPLTDTKGFRRSALSIAAQSKWKQAGELRLLAAEHRERAKRLYAKKQR